MDNPTRGMFENVSPKLTFWFGVIAAIAMISSLGFFMLLAQTLEGSASVKGTSTNKATAGSGTQPNQPTQPSQPTVPSDPIPTGSIALDSLTDVRGEGKYTIVEYSDTECPFCKRFHSTMQQVLQANTGKVRWVYKHFPIPSLHSKAPREANATECAAAQGKFWEYTDELFVRTPSNDGLEDTELFSIADAVKLDRKKFDTCMEQNANKDLIDAESQEARQFGAEGTPYSLVIDEKGTIVNVINGAQSTATIQAILDETLKN